MKSVLYYIAAVTFTVVYFLLFAVIFVVTVPFDRERVVLHHASRFWALGIFRINPAWSVKVAGKENIRKGVPCVVVVNHSSMLDIPIMYALPINFKWVSKREVYKIPIFGWVLWMHGDIAIKRGSAASAKKMMSDCAKRLERGTSVIIFPEGTRTKDGELGAFKDGAFRLAKSSGVPVLPCYVKGTGTLMDGWRFRMPHRFEVTILPEVRTDEMAQKDAKVVAESVREMIVKVKDGVSAVQ